MSTNTMSPSSLLAAQWAAVAPTLPAPMMLNFARRMIKQFLSFPSDLADYEQTEGRFNLSGTFPTKGCHPEPYSAKDLASQVGKILREYAQKDILQLESDI